MKTKVFIVLLLALSITAVAQQKKVAVLDPICRDSSVNTFFSQTVRGAMENVISATDEYQAYDRTAFDKIMEEHHFQRSGAVNDADIKQMGVMAGVDYILVPELSAYEGYLSVNVKILNVETGRYDKSANEIVEMDPPKVKKVCGEMAKKMFGVSDVTTGQRNGELQLPDGKYIGEYKDGKPHGKGIVYYKEDDPYERLSYEGDWGNGKKSGKGKMIWKDGEVFEGSWINNERNGQGTYVFPDGEKYEGNYSNGKRNGQGTFYWSNGNKYVGHWKDGQRSGFGIKYFLSGEWKGGRYEGYWENDMYNGEGTYFWADGSKVVCNWKDDKKHGQGTFYPKNGGWQRGNYVNGERDGEWKNNEGKKAKYRNGEIVRGWH